MKLSKEQWDKIIEADNSPVDEEAIKEFNKRVDEFIKEHPNIIIKEING